MLKPACVTVNDAHTRSIGHKLDAEDDVNGVRYEHLVCSARPMSVEVAPCLPSNVLIVSACTGLSGLGFARDGKRHKGTTDREHK